MTLLWLFVWACSADTRDERHSARDAPKGYHRKERTRLTVTARLNYTTPTGAGPHSNRIWPQTSDFAAAAAKLPSEVDQKVCATPRLTVDQGREVPSRNCIKMEPLRRCWSGSCSARQHKYSTPTRQKGGSKKLRDPVTSLAISIIVVAAAVVDWPPLSSKLIIGSAHSSAGPL